MSAAQPLWLLERVDRQAEDLHVALVELGLDLRHVAELGGAHRREVLGVREQHAPAVAQVVVELDRAFGGLRREVRGFVAQVQRHRSTSLLRSGKRPQAMSATAEKSSGLVGIQEPRGRAYHSPARAFPARSRPPARRRRPSAAGIPRLPVAVVRRAHLADRYADHDGRAVRAGRPPDRIDRGRRRDRPRPARADDLRVALRRPADRHARPPPHPAARAGRAHGRVDHPPRRHRARGPAARAPLPRRRAQRRAPVGLDADPRRDDAQPGAAPRSCRRRPR